MTRIEGAGAPVLLTYCTNVHPGETVAAIEGTLAEVTAAVKEDVFPDRPFGLGLWLSRAVADELDGDARRRARFARFLAGRGFFPFTLNAFPYGGFHAARVKEQVFRPSWAEPERLEYTTRCARVLATLLPADIDGSISTVPLGLRAAGFDDAGRARAVEHLREMADRLAALEAATGRHVVLCLEPEPEAELESLDQAVDFLVGEVFRDAADPRRRHLGLCHDACHEAVLFRDPVATLARIAAAGVRIGKLQVSAALEAPRPAQDPTLAARLRAFDEGRYFHQVAVRRADGTLLRYPDLAPFLADLEAGRVPADADAARVHFHVPVFAAPAGNLRTTRDELERALGAVRAAGGTRHLEVETYTFDVLPAAERPALGATSLAGFLARELRWTLAAWGS